jgi:hypothetical protein
MCKHPDTLTAEALSTYQPGWECICPDFNPYRCTCGANWTPREVYELRNMVLDLENQLGQQKALADASLDALARAEKANQDLESSARDLLDRAWARNAELEDYISGISHASSYMLNKETRRAMFDKARKYAINKAQGQYDYNAPPSTNYALEA